MRSSLTAIAEGVPWYRGLAVPDLAATRTFEEVATWLWTAQFPIPPPAGLPGGRVVRRWRRDAGPRRHFRTPRCRWSGSG